MSEEICGQLFFFRQEFLKNSEDISTMDNYFFFVLTKAEADDHEIHQEFRSTFLQ